MLQIIQFILLLPIIIFLPYRFCSSFFFLNRTIGLLATTTRSDTTLAVWMQEEVMNAEVAEIASRAGLKVVMDRCMRKEHQKLQGQTDGD
ncbi:CoA-binding protein [Chloroflexota bacterium]